MDLQDKFIGMTANVVEKIARIHNIPAILQGEYRNPFDFLLEFEEWFEFEKRRRFDKEPTCKIISQMLSHDLARASKSMDVNYTMVQRIAVEYFGRAVFESRRITSHFLD